MKTSKTAIAIIDHLRKYPQSRVDDISRNSGYSKSIIHRYLSKLVRTGEITKIGKPPKVYYQLTSSPNSTPLPVVDPSIRNFVEQNYMYTGSSQIYQGLAGFQEWAKNTNQQFSQKLVQEYVDAAKAVKLHFANKLYVDATSKLKSTFPNTKLKGVFYGDFYSLPRFGKTKLGQIVSNAKQAQSAALIRQVGELIKPSLLQVISDYRIEALAFIPPSIPRKVQILTELEKTLSLKLPKIKLDKVFRGQEIIPQKSLPNLWQRVENARDTIFVRDSGVRYKNVLLIDDLIGSGATVNDVSKKLVEMQIGKSIYAYALVGSYKGFDVVPSL